MDKEIWKDVLGYEGLYQVSNFGKVKSLRRLVNGKANKPRVVQERLLKPTVDGHGYLTVRLYRSGKGLTNKVHVLVAEHFLSHFRCGAKLVVDHIDENKLNCMYWNLQIVTTRTNITKSMKSGHSSKYIGVQYRKDNKKWKAVISIEGERVYLGQFLTEYEAHLAYQKALEELK